MGALVQKTSGLSQGPKKIGGKVQVAVQPLKSSFDGGEIGERIHGQGRMPGIKKKFPYPLTDLSPRDLFWNKKSSFPGENHDGASGKGLRQEGGDLRMGNSPPADFLPCLT